MVRRLLLLEGGRSTGEKRSAIIPSQHAGEHTVSIGLALLQDATALRHPYQAVVSGIGYPNCPSASRQMPSGATAHCLRISLISVDGRAFGC